jgi:hypothetical protein
MSALPPRLELKYCLPDEEAVRILRVASLFLEPDRGRAAPQRITSLYLDSPTLTFLGWQRTRRPDRFKLRLRCYGDLPPAVVYAEVKGKLGRRVHKQRAAIPASSVRPLLEDAMVPVPPAEPLQAPPGLEAFGGRMRAFGAAAQVLLRVERESLRGATEDPALGVTVDRCLEYQRWQRPNVGGDPGAWSRLPLPLDCPRACAVLELKHGSQRPAWMHAVMGALAPWRRSFSKYAAAMAEVLAAEGGR